MVGTVDSWTTGWAIQPRGSASIRLRSRVQLLGPVARGPITIPLPPDPSTGLTTSSSSRSITSSRCSGSSSRQVCTLGRIGSSSQVVADQVRDVGVDELVVGDAVADRVRDGDVAGPGRVDQAGTAEQRVLPEVHRVEELVVHPPVDHVHRLQPDGGPHHHPAGPAHQVAALDQLDAHQPGQQRVLEVGGVVHPGRQHHHLRVVHPGRRGRPQRGEQPARIAVPPAGSGGRRTPRAARWTSPGGSSSRRTPRTAPGRCPPAPGSRRRRRGSGRCPRRAPGLRWAA